MSIASLSCPPPLPTFNEALKATRLALKLRQSDVADAIGLSKSAISQYENGKRVPADAVFKILTGYYEAVIDKKTAPIRQRVAPKLSSVKFGYQPRRPGPKPRLSAMRKPLGAAGSESRQYANTISSRKSVSQESNARADVQKAMA